jgi:hypothetical protein
MADKSLSTKKFEYQRGGSKDMAASGNASGEGKEGAETTSSSRPGIPLIGQRPAPPTTAPPSSYASGSQTERNAGRTAARHFGRDENAIGIASIGTAVIVNSSASTTSATTTATTANSSVAGSTSSTSTSTSTSTSFAVDPDSVGGNIGVRWTPLSIVDRAENLQSQLPMKSPRAMPPLPLPSSGNKAQKPAPANDSPPPPSDVPPSLAAKPGSMSTPRQPSTTQPAFVDELASPRSTQSGLTIRQIAADIVAAEVENGLDLKQIGRLSPKLGGVSVYGKLGAYVNREMANSEFLGVVEKCRQAVMQRFARKPEKLTVVEGSTTGAGGEHTGVDLERIAKFITPIFDFVCGSAQRFGDCGLPTGVQSLFKAIDRELLACLLARREQQLTAQKLWSATMPPDSLATKLKELGWTESQFKKLVNEGVFSAANIHAFRVNMFTGLLFTRCISPFILYSAEELQQESSKRTASPARPLVKLSEGANKLFKKNYAGFVEDFVLQSNSVLPESSALALVTMSSGEERFSKVKTSKKSPSGGSKSYSRSPGRHSAPVLPQGGDFRKLMENEKKAVDAEASSPAHGRAPVDPKIRRDAAIDKFKSRHADDFGDEDFAIAFTLALRLWKRDNREIDIEAVPLAMKRLYQQVKKELAGREKLERDGPPVQSATRRPNKSSSQSASTSTTPSIHTSNALQPSLAKVALTDERNDLLERFARKVERRASFERYPALKARMQQQAIAWAQKDTGGSFGLALKQIFEAELVRCFYRTYQLMGDVPNFSRKELQLAVNVWKADNKGGDLTVEALWRIMPKIIRPLTLDTVKPTSLTRNAEAMTEIFLERPDVARELEVNPLLTKRFLHDIRLWIATGAHSIDPASSVQQLYHEALTAQYQEQLKAEGADASVVGNIKLAAMQWWADNDAAVLTMEVLRGLHASIENGE